MAYKTNKACETYKELRGQHRVAAILHFIPNGKIVHPQGPSSSLKHVLPVRVLERNYPRAAQPVKRERRQYGRIVMYLILLGPPGAGKGTQAEQLEKELHLPHVASGDLFRENLKNETELGLLAKTYMDRGDLVPDDVTIAMVRRRLQRPDCAQGAILDGFPRTQTQAEGLDKMLADMRRRLDGVLYIAVPDEELVRRLSGRWICRQCQTPYHTIFSPPAKEGICDACGGELYQRDDDRPETVQARLKVYHRQTAPLIDYYRQAGLLVEVDGSGDIETVSAALLEAVHNLAKVGQRL